MLAFHFKWFDGGASNLIHYKQIFQEANNLYIIFNVSYYFLGGLAQLHLNFKQNLKTNSAAVKQYQESLSPDEKAQVLVTHATEQQNYQQSLSP